MNYPLIGEQTLIAAMSRYGDAALFALLAARWRLFVGNRAGDDWIVRAKIRLG
jgi:hypothetical protein